MILFSNSSGKKIELFQKYYQLGGGEQVVCISSHRKKNKLFKKKNFYFQSPQPSSGLTDTEKKEKQALEKKLAEMEEELKVSLKKMFELRAFDF